MNEPKSKPMKRFRIGEYVGVSVLLAVLTFFLLWPAYQNARDSFSAQQWPSVVGKIVESQRSTSQNGSGRTSISYRFRYEYQVDGQNYSSRRYSFRYPSGDRSTGIERHRTGSAVTIHYNPDHPERSVIDVQSSAWWNYLVLGFSTLISLLAIMAVVGRKPATEKR